MSRPSAPPAPFLHRLVLALLLGGTAIAAATAEAALPGNLADFEVYKQAQDKASNAAYQNGDYDRCAEIETEVLALSRKFADRKEEASALYGLGLVGTATGKPDEAEARFREAIAIWKQLGHQKQVALGLRGLGRVLEARGQLPEATEVQVAALEVLLKYGNAMDQSESYYSLARLFMNLESFPSARRAVDRAIALMGPKPPDFPLGLNLALRADVLRELGEFSAARSSAEEGLAAFKRANSRIGEAIGQLALGKALAATGEADRGLQMLRAGEAIALESKEAVLATDLQFAEGAILVQAKRFEEALKPLAAAQKTADDLHLDQLRRNISLEQEKAYSGLGRPAEALAASKRAFESQGRIAGLEKIGQIAGRSAESQLSAINSRFMSLDSATRATATVLAAPKPVAPPPSRFPTPPPGGWLLALLALIGLFVLARRQRRLHAQAEQMQRDQAALADAHAQLQDHSAQLAQQVSIDPLTGVLTRRAFTEELANALQLAQAAALPLTLAVFDLDHFKQVNDRHGHLTGDAALRLLVGLVREQLDSEDLFGRFGGDEFLLASRTDMQAMHTLCERIRASVQARSLAPDSGLPPLSISLGLAQADPVRGFDAESLFHRADTALYEAKAGGRNRVVLAGDGVDRRQDPRTLLHPADSD